jgi:hypothetical protein
VLRKSWTGNRCLSNIPYLGSGVYRGGKVKLSLCLINQALCDEGVWGSGYIDPHFLDLSSSWRLAISFTPRPLYPQGKELRYPLDRRVGMHQSWSG